MNGHFWQPPNCSGMYTLGELVAGSITSVCLLIFVLHYVHWQLPNVYELILMVCIKDFLQIYYYIYKNTNLK